MTPIAPPVGTPTAEAPPIDASPGEHRLEFVRPLAGLPGSLRYALRPLGREYEPFATIDSVDEPGLRLVVAPPALLFDDYVIEVPDADCEALVVDAPDHVGVLVIVRLDCAPVPVANLMAPIVVNRATGAAAQVVLDGSGYGLMVPVDAGSARP